MINNKLKNVVANQHLSEDSSQLLHSELTSNSEEIESLTSKDISYIRNNLNRAKLKVDTMLPKSAEEVHPKLPKLSEEVHPKLPNLSEEVHPKIPKLSEEVHPKLPKSTEEVPPKLPKLSEEVYPKLSKSAEEVHPKLPKLSEEVHPKLPKSAEEVHPKLPELSEEVHPKLPKSSEEPHSKLPKSAEEVHQYINSVPINTMQNENFILINDELLNMIVFSCDTNLKLLCAQPTLYVNGSFDRCMEYFLELFVIFAIVSRRYLPLVFCVLKNKTRETYSGLFRQLKRKCEEKGLRLKPDNIVMHLETEMHEAAREVFPGVGILVYCIQLAEAW
ncbi:hypothetical protein Trydic_g15656 [Trypoxylus dichotomus]